MSDVISSQSSIAIRAETSIADPDSCKFTVSKMVHPGGPFFFDSLEKAAGSPLVERLFALAGVAHVLVAGHVVTIGKKKSAYWARLRLEVGSVIRTQLSTGVRAILETPRPAPPGNRNDDEIREVIQALLDQETNPSIASHGGKISIVEVRGRKLYIEMSGGCQGCAASQLTLRQGFELMVRRVAPEVLDIIDATDHASGTSPFYKHTVA